MNAGHGYFQCRCSGQKEYEEADLARRAAVIRVRVKRRIFMALGVQAGDAYPLSALLRLAMRLEAK